MADAHPVPRKSHDRSIDIRLEAARVVIRYRLEVDALTIVLDDLPAIDDQVDITKLKKPDEFYDAFTRGYAPILADNLTATLDGKPLKFQCEKRNHTLFEDDGKPLDHVHAISSSRRHGSRPAIFGTRSRFARATTNSKRA